MASRWDWLTVGLGAAVLVAVAALYLRTAARDIVVGDTPELIAVAVTLGVAHSPGYPLYTLLGHLFSLLPIDPVPFRLTLFSVVCQVAAVGLVYVTAWRLGAGPFAAAGAALLLALNPLFWTWSLVAEVFPLNNALAAGLILLLVVWEQRPERVRYLALAALVFGLALANHQTIVLLVPGILFLLWRRRAVLLRRPGTIVGCAALLTTGLALYLYVPWAASRDPAFNWQDVASFGDLVSLVTRQQYGTGQLVTSGALSGGSPLTRLNAWFASFPIWEGLLLLGGLIVAGWALRWYLAFVLLLVALAGPGFALYANINLDLGTLFVLERFFLLSHVVLAPLGALALAGLANLVTRATPRVSTRGASAAVAGAVALGVGMHASAILAAVDMSDSHVARTAAEDALATLDPGTIFYVSGDNHILPILYLQVVEGLRPDVRTVIEPLLVSDWYVRQLTRRQPEIRIPFRQSDKSPDTFARIVAANAGSTIATYGLAQDHSVRETHYYYNRGLVLQVEPYTTPRTVRQIADENERLMGIYRPPSHVRDNPLERDLLTAYARMAFRMGAVTEDAKLPFAAEIWYQRSVTIDPGYAPGYRGLGKLELDRGNPDAALGHLRKALSLAPTDTEARDLLQRAVGAPPTR